MTEVEFWIRHHGRFVYLVDETNSKEISWSWKQKTDFEFTTNDGNIVVIDSFMVDMITWKKEP